MQILLLLVSLLCCLVPLKSQNVHLSRIMPSVEVDGQTLDLAFAGGLNSPQFSAVDFNNDGREDIFIFDRVGDVSMAFLRQEDNSFKLVSQMLLGFPDLYGWALLRDYDDDGVMDIFTYNRDFVSGVRVFKGYYTADNQIAFERFATGNTPNILFAAFPGINETQLYVSEIDLPAIDDLDCDGDLDILTFNIAGGFIEYYQNQSVENGYNRDSLQYTMVDNCYGGIFESGLTNALDFASAVGECANDLVGEELIQERHTGSALLTFDEDGDGDRDLILGDLSFGNLNMSTNANNCTEAWMNQQDTQFPSYDVSVDLPIFPAAFYLDVNADGKRDLIAAPNPGTNGVDHQNVWYYLNTGQDDEPQFGFVQNDFLVGEMIDLGTGAKPALLDYNADGLMDLVVGNFSFFEFFGEKNARLNLYENIGTASQPAFRLVDEDYLNMHQFSNSTFSFSPAFGDMDADGDMDALIGEINGKLFYLENTAGSGNPVSFAAPVYDYMGIDIGQASTPQIIDLNRDGLPDLIIGEKGGNINYFQNTGTQASPQFGNDEEVLPNVKRLGEVDTRMPGFTTGYSSPQFIDFMGEYRLYVGTQFGPIEVYGNIDNNLLGAAFDQLSVAMANLHEGKHIHPLLYDWNADDFLELLVGNYRGGLSFFDTNILWDGTVNINEKSIQDILIYPNPAVASFTIAWPLDGAFNFELYNAIGQKVLAGHADESLKTVQISHLPKGIYFLRCQGDDLVYKQRLVVR